MRSRRILALLLVLSAALIGANQTFLKEPGPPPSVPNFRGCSTVKGAGPALTLGFPPNVENGDLVLAFVENQGETSTLSGWTQLCAPVEQTGGSCPGSDACTSLFSFYATHSGSLNYTTNDSGASQIGTVCAVQVGTFDTTTPYEQCTATKDVTGDTSISINGGTTTVDYTVVVEVHSAEWPDSNSTTICSSPSNSNLDNIIEQIDGWRNTGSGGGVCVWTGELDTAGSVGTFTATRASSGLENNISFAVRPD